MTVKRTIHNVSYRALQLDAKLNISHTLEELLFELSLCNLNFHCLIDLFRMAASVVGVVLDCGGEEGVNEGCFSKARLSCNLRSIVSTNGCTERHIGHTIMVKAAPRFATIL